MKRIAAMLLALLLAGCGQAGPSSQASSSPPPASSAPAAASAATKPAPSAAAKPAPSASGLTQIATSYAAVSGNFIPWWMAQDSGIYAAHGLSVDMRYLAGSANVAGLMAGELQLPAIGGGDAIAAAANGADLVILATMIPSYTFVIVTSASIKTPADLKGKRIGVSTLGSASDIGTRVGLRKLGLDPVKDQIQTVQEGNTVNAVAAMKAGAIDGATVTPPDNVKLEQEGYHVLIDLSKLDIPAATNVIGARASWLSGHRDVAQNFIDSLILGINRTKNDKPAAMQVIQKYLKLGDPRLEAAIYDYYTQSVFPSLPYPKPEQFTDAVAEMSVSNAKLKGFDATKTFDTSFVKSAADRGLDKLSG